MISYSTFLFLLCISNLQALKKALTGSRDKMTSFQKWISVFSVYSLGYLPCKRHIGSRQSDSLKSQMCEQCFSLYNRR